MFSKLAGMFFYFKIVLNLLTFDDDNEWKISRLSRLLSNKRFVVSERGGAPEEEVSRFHS